MDTLQLVTFSPGGRPILSKDIETGVFYSKYRDSFRITPGDKHQQIVSGNRRYGGQKIVGESHDNWEMAATWLIQGASVDNCEANLSTFLASLEDITPGGFIKFQPEGGSFPVFFERRGSAKWNPNYRWVVMSGAQAIAVEVSLPIAPLARGYPMDIGDPFDVDSSADYTADIGSKANVSITGGAMTAVANLATENRLIHTARSYKYGDVEPWLQATPGTTITAFKAGTPFNWVDGNNFIEGYVDDNGTNSRLRVDVMLAGVRTNRATVNLAARLVTGRMFWVRPRIEGNVVFLDYWDNVHPLDAAATLSTPLYTLSAAEAAVLGATAVGKVGISWIPQSNNATINYFRAWPFTYALSGVGDWPLAGAIPGDAPALATLYYQNAVATAQVMKWMGFGWTPRIPVYNMCSNGDFDTLQTTEGWSVAAVTNINGTATSVPIQSSGLAKYGTFMGEIVCPATSGTGVNFRTFRKFRRGTTYTFDVWVYSAAQVTPVIAKVGNASANDVASSAPVALSAAYQKLSVQWTPTADRYDAHIGVVINAATATTFRVDGIEVYEGTVAPTSDSQIQGRGAYPPFGLLQGEEGRAGVGGSLVLTADATSRSGFNRTASSIGAGFSTELDWWIDPSLLVPDDFAGDEVQVEVWARMNVATFLTAATAQITVTPESGLEVRRFTAEYSTAKSLLTNPGFTRLYRLGTLTLNARVQDRQKLALMLTATGDGAAHSTLMVDELVLFPARRRACSASGKRGDWTTYGYPYFLNSVSATAMKTVAPDLSAIVSLGSRNPSTSSGLGGSLLEMPAGNLNVCVRPSGSVPDDPTQVDVDGADLTPRVHFGFVPRWQLLRDA